MQVHITDYKIKLFFFSKVLDPLILITKDPGLDLIGLCIREPVLAYHTSDDLVALLDRLGTILHESELLHVLEGHVLKKKVRVRPHESDPFEIFPNSMKSVNHLYQRQIIYTSKC